MERLLQDVGMLALLLAVVLFFRFVFEHMDLRIARSPEDADEHGIPGETGQGNPRRRPPDGRGWRRQLHRMRGGTSATQRSARDAERGHRRIAPPNPPPARDENIECEEHAHESVL